MIWAARERVGDLFALAEREASRPGSALSDRYVRLARRVGMRYNVRLLPELREVYCRGCSVYWVEGRTVRTRLRAGRRTRTCLVCGRRRRTRLRPGGSSPSLPGSAAAASGRATPAIPVDEQEETAEDDEEPSEGP